MNRIIFKSMIVFILSITLFSINGLSAYAIDGSRFFTGVLFFSGLGASFAGGITQGQANKIYDDYLHSAIQKDMDRLIGDYDKKNQQSIIASRVGIGLTASAILISLFDSYHITQVDVQKASSDSSLLRGIASADVQNGEIKLSVKHHF
jgi:hypothetical protein